ncbi:MAG TPA: RNA polymerase sigma factor [Patescibacteria group bacterium]|nr:RNA polymerase sigma factor [Patescibacteria group bacterium]
MNSHNDKQERFLQLFLPLQSRLEKFILVQVRNREMAKDIMSETVMLAFESFDSLKNDETFLSFLFTIASRVSSRRFKNSHRMAEYSEQYAEELMDSGISPEDAADVAILRSAIQQLPEMQREAIIMHEILDLPLDEVLKIQGGTLSGVKVRLMRARRQLAKMLASPESDEAFKNGAFKNKSVMLLLLSLLHF